MERFRLPAGTVIRCPNEKCRAYVGRIEREVKAQDRMKDCIEGPMVRWGERPRCHVCGRLWYFQEAGFDGKPITRLSTGWGWYPETDRIKEDQ